MERDIVLVVPMDLQLARSDQQQPAIERLFGKAEDHLPD